MTVDAYFLFEATPEGEKALEKLSLHNAKQRVFPAMGDDVFVHIAGHDAGSVGRAADALAKLAGVRSSRQLDGPGPSWDAVGLDLKAVREKLQKATVREPDGDLGKRQRAFRDEAVRTIDAGLHALEKMREHLRALDSAAERLDRPLDALLDAWKTLPSAADDPDAALDAAEVAKRAEVAVIGALEDVGTVAEAVKL